MSQAKPDSFLARYDAAVADGSITPDPAQRKAAEAFEQLFQRLIAPDAQPKNGFFSRLLGTGQPAISKNGMYLWGDVGRGKSMLMDMFVETITPHRLTRRIHFHAFMREVHHMMYAWRQTNKDGDLLERVIKDLAQDMPVLCLDELQVTDVTDAMILSRLFAGLMDAGVTVVFTSNRPPRELYQGGLQREQFIKFVELLEARIPIVSLAAKQDYRLAQLKAMKQTYMYPRGEASDNFLCETWKSLTHGAPNDPLRIEVDGRTLRVDKHSHGVAWLTFAELCMRPLGAGDYLELCQYCHTILLQGIPRLTREERNEAKRFVTLIDTLYDHRVKLIATAETPPEEIYEQGDGTFEFARTVSRLIEMQSETYLALPKI